MDIASIMLDENTTKLGGVETWDDARRCAELFRRHADTIDGILVCLPNFGDEKGVADTIKLTGLQVPILVQAYPDDLDRLQDDLRGCRFAARCPLATDLCRANEPELIEYRPRHFAACHYAETNL